MAGCKSTSCESRRRRGGGRVENPLDLPACVSLSKCPESMKTDL